MKPRYWIYVIFVQFFKVFVVRCVIANEATECDAWKHIKDNVQTSHGAKISCTVNNVCTGLNCNGTYEEYEFKSAIEIKPCSEPISIDIYADVPELGIHKWKHSITHGEKINIPGSEVHVLGQTVQAYLYASYQRVEDDLVLQLTLQPDVAGKSSFISWPLVRDLRIKIPDCKDGKPVTHAPSPSPQPQSTQQAALAVSETPLVEKAMEKEGMGMCEIGNLTGCKRDEICIQDRKGSDLGHCECQVGFVRDSKGLCVPVVTDSPSVPATPDVAGPTAEASSANAPEPSSHTTHVILMAVLIPLAILIVIVAAAVFSLKPDIIRSLRDRLRSQQYEHPLIGRGEEGELSDPVA